MNDSQQKKSAIIAGMAPGFGAAIAKTLIADGYNVYGLSRKSSLEEKTSARLTPTCLAT